MKDRRGFTLVEMVIVIAIILILAALMIGVINTVMTNAQNQKTAALIKMLDDGCRTYKQEYNIYPPNDKGDSRCLHYYLGRERVKLLDKDTNIKTTRPPIIEFKADMLEEAKGVPDPKNPSPVVDVWGRKIQYKTPGKYNQKHVDIWSSGKNGNDELDPAAKDFDDVVNWAKIEG
jgi:prepilin-type N-terminal cleavage/methylation domain-containing protein